MKPTIAEMTGASESIAHAYLIAEALRLNNELLADARRRAREWPPKRPFGGQ